MFFWLRDVLFAIFCFVFASCPMFSLLKGWVLCFVIMFFVNSLVVNVGDVPAGVNVLALL